MREYLLYIDGQFVPAASGATFETLNPFDQSVVADVARAGAADADAAVKAARTAFDQGPWPRMSAEERAAMVEHLDHAAVLHRTPPLLDLVAEDPRVPTARRSSRSRA